jgi:hypothetical protein
MQWIGFEMVSDKKTYYDVIPFWPDGVSSLLALWRSSFFDGCCDRESGVVVVTADSRDDALAFVRERFAVRDAARAVPLSTNKSIPMRMSDLSSGKLRRTLMELMDEAMLETDGVQVEAARILGITARALNYHLDQPELQHWREELRKRNQ